MHIYKLILILFAVPALTMAGLEWDTTLMKLKAEPGQAFSAVEFVGTNTGTAPVVIDSLKSSCGCTTGAIGQKVVAPGEKTAIQLRFEFGVREGVHRKQVEVITTDGKRHVLSVQVDIPRSYKIVPKLLRWSLSEGRAPKVVRMINESDQAIHLVYAQSSIPFFDVELNVIEPGFEYEVRVTPAETGDSARGVVTMSIQPNGAQNLRTYKFYTLAK